MCFFRTTRVYNQNGKSTDSVGFAQLTECRRARWRHVANTIELVHTGATWRIRLNMCFLGPIQTQTTNRSVQSLLHSSRQNVYNGRPFPPKLPPSHWGSGVVESGPPYNLWFLGPAEPTTQTECRSVQPFLTAECSYFTMGRPFPQNCPFPWGILTGPSNTWFPGPTRVLNPNGISIGSAVFAGLTCVTDRQADRQTTPLGR